MKIDGVDQSPVDVENHRLYHVVPCGSEELAQAEIPDNKKDDHDVKDVVHTNPSFSATPAQVVCQTPAH
jgi:hypothetical protein